MASRSPKIDNVYLESGTEKPYTLPDGCTSFEISIRDDNTDKKVRLSYKEGGTADQTGTEDVNDGYREITADYWIPQNDIKFADSAKIYLRSSADLMVDITTFSE